MSLRVDIAVADNLQRQDEFVAILILAPADIGLRRQHTQPVIGQRVTPVIGFAAPDRKHDGSGNAEARFDRLQGGAIFLHQPLPLAGQPRDAGFLDVICRHLHEFGLRRRAGRGPSGQDQIGQFVIRLEPRVSASKVARETPAACASGHSEAMNCGEGRVGGAGCS